MGSETETELLLPPQLRWQVLLKGLTQPGSRRHSQTLSVSGTELVRTGALEGILRSTWHRADRFGFSCWFQRGLSLAMTPLVLKFGKGSQTVHPAGLRAASQHLPRAEGAGAWLRPPTPRTPASPAGQGLGKKLKYSEGSGVRVHGLEGHVEALQLTPKEQVCLSPEPGTTSKGSFRSFLCLSKCFGKNIFSS